MTGADARQRTHSEAETAAVARRLARRMTGGAVLLLYGDLGAGKTAFVRGMVEGLGGDPNEVSSPTFTLVQPYVARITVQHVDLYRLRPEEVPDLGLDELITPQSVVVIEWADRLPTRLPNATTVTIEDRGDDERDILIAGSLLP